MQALRSLLVLGLLLAASACAAPLQNGGVDVRPGAEMRIGILCRYQPPAGTKDVCSPPLQGEEE
jgi:hypothetical protein